MIGQVYIVLFTLTIVTLLIPLTFFYLNFHRQSSELRWLTMLLSFSVLCDLTGIVLTITHSNPNFAGFTYWLVSTGVLSVFFSRIIGFKSNRVVVLANIVYVLFAIANFLWIQGANALNTYTGIFQSIVILALSISYYYKLLRELPTQQLHRLPFFWIVSGFFFTYAGKLVVYTVTHYLTHFAADDLIIIWSFHNFLTIIANLLIGYGAWLNHKQLKSTSLSLSRS